MKCNYKFLANLLHIFVKYANKYCIIGDIICINMHHLTVQHCSHVTVGVGNPTNHHSILHRRPLPELQNIIFEM